MDGSARRVREGRLSAAGQQPLNRIGLPRRLAVTGHDPICGGQNPLAARLERGLVLGRRRPRDSSPSLSRIVGTRKQVSAYGDEIVGNVASRQRPTGSITIHSVR
jgi:hypothetical protein